MGGFIIGGGGGEVLCFPDAFCDPLSPDAPLRASPPPLPTVDWWEGEESSPPSTGGSDWLIGVEPPKRFFHILSLTGVEGRKSSFLHVEVTVRVFRKTDFLSKCNIFLAFSY